MVVPAESGASTARALRGHLVLGALVALSGCATARGPLAVEPEPDTDDGPADPTPTPPSAVARIGDRVIDLGAALTAFPYSGFRAWPELNVLVYRDLERTMRLLPLNGTLDLPTGRALAEDWSNRPIQLGPALPEQRAVLAHAEIDDGAAVFSLNLDDGRLTRLTAAHRVVGYAPTADRAGLWTLTREAGGATTCLERGTLGGATQRVLCDDEVTRFAPRPPLVSADGARVWITTWRGGDRRRAGLVQVELTSPRPLPRALLPDLPRTVAAPLAVMPDGSLLVRTDDGDSASLLRVRGAAAQRFSSLQGVGWATVLTEPGPAVLAIVHHPSGADIVLLDEGGELLARQALPGSLQPVGTGPDAAWLLHSGRDQPPALLRVRRDGLGGFLVQTLLAPRPEQEAAMRRCAVREVWLPTFDIDPQTGEQRRLHAFWSEPLDGPPHAALVDADGLGVDAWDRASQLRCEAGVATLSPTVRGAPGHGRRFAELGAGDIGGGAVRDLQAAGTWVVGRGVPPGRIGLIGAGLGGYRTLRALTWPEPDFAFGFGVAIQPFTDLERFAASDPAPEDLRWDPADAALADARSPLRHVGALAAPVLLLHGEGDARIPVDESRRFADACREAGGRCTLRTFPGAAHGLPQLADQVALWQATFELIGTLPGP